METYKQPSLRFGTPLKSQARVVITLGKPKLSAADLKRVPAHFKDSGAMKGDRGGRLCVQGAAPFLVYSLGRAADLTQQDVTEYGEACGHWLNQERIKDVFVQLPEEWSQEGDAGAEGRMSAYNFIKGMLLANFKMNEFRSTPPKASSTLRTITLSKQVQKTWAKLNGAKRVAALVNGIAFARALAEMPPNVASPMGIVERFKQMAPKSITVEVWDEKRIAKEGMGLIQAVSQGSATPPRVLIARYGSAYKGKAPSLYFVGKGVTFDTGGVNLKASGSWKELMMMKKDMSGAAGVLGAILAIAEIGMEVPVVAITPLTTNCLDAASVIPSDIVRSYAGKTVEIMNTDAEGRLVLADAIHIAVKEKADYLVDVATLTGACAVALGAHYTGLFSNNDRFQEIFRKIADEAGEPSWPMPMGKRYGAELKSELADLSNMGNSREGGAQLGAKFIENFVGGIPWCHLDIAGSDLLGGPASAGAAHKSAGRMVHSLVRLAFRAGEGALNG